MVIAIRWVIGKLQCLNATTFCPQGVVHGDVEAVADVEGLQVGAVVKDDRQSFVGEILAKELQGAQPVHRCNPQSSIVLDVPKLDINLRWYREDCGNGTH